MSLVLACDLGGSSFRAALVDGQGQTRAEAVRPSMAPGTTEVDPAQWWMLLLDCCAEIAARLPALFREVAGVAICGFTRTQVFLGQGGAPVRPAITWNDTRAAAAAERLRDRLEGRHAEAGQLNAFHPVARLAWLAEAEPAAFAAVETVLDPKDYLNLRLTGAAASDAVSLARLQAAAEPGAEGGADLLSACAASPRLLPRLREPWEAVGAVLPGLPAPLDRLAGVPVFCGSNDTWSAVVGLGAMRAGCGYNISGTTEVLGAVDALPHAAQGLLTVDWRGLHQIGGPSQTGADTLAWLIGLFGSGDVGAGLAKALAGPRQAQPVLFLPYLQGERVPHWDPALRGAFLGLHRSHGPADLAWAVMEGVAFLNRLVLERAEAAMGRPVSEIRFGGGGAVNALWCQVKADVTRRPVVVGAAPEPGVLGAAILAQTGLGNHASLDAAQDALVRVASRYVPDRARAAVYDGLYDIFRRAEPALAPLSHALAGLDAGPLHGPADRRAGDAA